MRRLSLIVSLLLAPVAARGAVAYDAYSAGTPGTGNQSWTHTPVGTPRAVVVYVICALAGVDEVSGVTYGGVAMAEVSGSPVVKVAAEAMTVHAFFLGANIPTGAQTVTITMSATTTYKGGHAYTLTGAADTEIIATQTISSNSVANPSATLSLVGRSAWAALGGVSGQDAATGTTPFANWTGRYEAAGGAQTGLTYTYDTVSTADVSAGWTQTADDAVMVAVAVGEVCFNHSMMGFHGCY